MLGISNREIEPHARGFQSVADAQSDGMVDAPEIIAPGFHAKYLAVFLRDGSALGRCRVVKGGGKITNDISIGHDFASRDSDLVGAGHRSLVCVAQDTRFVILAERHT